MNSTTSDLAYFIRVKASSVFNNCCVDINYNIIPFLNNTLPSYLID